MLLPFYSSIRERQDQLGSLGMHPTRDDRELGMLYGCDGQATVSLAGTLQVLFAVLSREGALRMEHGADQRGGLETYLRRRAGRSMTGGSRQRSLSSSWGSRSRTRCHRARRSRTPSPCVNPRPSPPAKPRLLLLLGFRELSTGPPRRGRGERGLRERGECRIWWGQED